MKPTTAWIVTATLCLLVIAETAGLLILALGGH